MKIKSLLQTEEGFEIQTSTHENKIYFEVASTSCLLNGDEALEISRMLSHAASKLNGKVLHI